MKFIKNKRAQTESKTLIKILLYIFGAVIIGAALFYLIRTFFS